MHPVDLTIIACYLALMAVVGWWSAKRASRNAEAYFLEPGYTFDKWPTKPKVYYRYSHFSGQRSTTGGATTAYDPMFYGDSALRMGFGTYYLGEIVGQYDLFNTNENVHQFGITLNPSFHVFD